MDDSITTQLDSNAAIDGGDQVYYSALTGKQGIDLDTEGIPKRHKIETDDQLNLDLANELDKFRMQRMEESRQRIYIPPMAKANLQARDDALFPLMEKTLEFLTGDQQVFLVLGDSGAGKSTFNLELERTLWKDYKEEGPIPLYINLPYIHNPAQDLIEKQLQHYDFTAEQIQEMKYHRQFVLICDGYDECQLTVNIYNTNRLNQEGQWRAKMIVSCRSQFLGSIYLDRFAPQLGAHDQRSLLDLFDEAVIAPFSTQQVEEYVTRYVPLEPRPWLTEDYMHMLTAVPNLMDLVKNPFLLTLALETLPALTKEKQDLSTLRIAR
ncbi:WD_REPEATS_REGION domain-containing protein, partial [Linnemannia exigua]